MTNTDTKDVKATYEQIKRLVDAGCDIVRVSVPDEESIKAFAFYTSSFDIPIVADIHFNYKLAIESIKAGAACVRVNPGNIGGRERLKEVVRAASDYGCAVRVGVNAGSLEKKILNKYGAPTPEALAESALYWSEFLEDMGFLNFKVSIKSSHVVVNYRAHMIFAEKSEAPIHLGITEAGIGLYGVVKSSVGIGALLLAGIGDTIRVSLTGDPVREVEVGKYILRCLGLRKDTVEIISCPTCARRKIDVEGVAKEVERRFGNLSIPIKIAVMGCEVNGPGEAKEADCGIAGGRDFSLIFKKGNVVKKVANSEALSALEEVINELKEERDAG